MPYPYSWKPDRMVPSNANQVKVLDANGNAATLSTAVSVSSGTVSFATTNPGTYTVVVNGSSDHEVSKTYTTNTTAGTGTPTAAAGSNAGTTPPAPVVVAGSTDSRGRITFGSGATPAAGNMVVVTFSNPYAAAPYVLATLGTANGVGLYITNVTTSGFTVGLSTAPAASQANTTYAVNYQVLV